MLHDSPAYDSEEEYIERAKLRLSRIITVILFVAIVSMAIAYWMLDITGKYQYTGGTILLGFSWWRLHFSKDYKLASFILIIGTLLLVTLSLFLDKIALHYIDPLWFICIGLYAFIMLGKVWGIVTFGYAAVTMSIFLSMRYVLQDAVQVVMLNGYSVATIIELCLCLTLMTYFISHFVDLVRHAKDKQLEAYNQLIVHNTELQRRENEKTVLLQEIHHRVKNNLQIVISLLRMQSAELESEEAKMNFQVAIDRVLSMAFIHQRMYEEKDFSSVSVKDYIQGLINDILRSYEKLDDIEVEIGGDVERLGLKSMVPLGLIITELVSNSMKHGLTQSGRLRINLINGVGKKFQLNYSDNGHWKEPQAKSFGLTLIDTLTEQLDGTYERDTENGGTHYTFALNDLEMI